MPRTDNYQWVVQSGNTFDHGTYLCGEPWIVDNGDLTITSVSPTEATVNDTTNSLSGPTNITLLNPDHGVASYAANEKVDSIDIRSVAKGQVWETDGMTTGASSGDQITTRATILNDFRGGARAGGSFTSTIGTEFYPGHGATFPLSVEAGDQILINTGITVDHVYGGNANAGDEPFTESLGVLTVVSSAPGASAFRPPVNWGVDIKSSRPTYYEMDDLRSGPGGTANEWEFPNYNFTSDTKTWTESSPATSSVDTCLGRMGPVLYLPSGNSELPGCRGSIQNQASASSEYGNFSATLNESMLLHVFDPNVSGATQDLFRRTLVQRGIDVYGYIEGRGMRLDQNGGHVTGYNPLIYLAWCVTGSTGMYNYLNNCDSGTGDYFFPQAKSPNGPEFGNFTLRQQETGHASWDSEVCSFRHFGMTVSDQGTADNLNYIVVNAPTSRVDEAGVEGAVVPLWLTTSSTNNAGARWGRSNNHRQVDYPNLWDSAYVRIKGQSGGQPYEKITRVVDSEFYDANGNVAAGDADRKNPASGKFWLMDDVIPVEGGIATADLSNCLVNTRPSHFNKHVTYNIENTATEAGVQAYNYAITHGALTNWKLTEVKGGVDNVPEWGKIMHRRSTHYGADARGKNDLLQGFSVVYNQGKLDPEESLYFALIRQGPGAGASLPHTPYEYRNGYQTKPGSGTTAEYWRESFSIPYDATWEDLNFDLSKIKIWTSPRYNTNSGGNVYRYSDFGGGSAGTTYADDMSWISVDPDYSTGVDTLRVRSNGGNTYGIFNIESLGLEAWLWPLGCRTPLKLERVGGEILDSATSWNDYYTLKNPRNKLQPLHWSRGVMFWSEITSLAPGSGFASDFDSDYNNTTRFGQAVYDGYNQQSATADGNPRLEITDDNFCNLSHPVLHLGQPNTYSVTGDFDLDIYTFHGAGIKEVEVVANGGNPVFATRVDSGENVSSLRHGGHYRIPIEFKDDGTGLSLGSTYEIRVTSKPNNGYDRTVRMRLSGLSGENKITINPNTTITSAYSTIQGSYDATKRNWIELGTSGGYSIGTPASAHTLRDYGYVEVSPAAGVSAEIDLTYGGSNAGNLRPNLNNMKFENIAWISRIVEHADWTTFAADQALYLEDNDDQTKWWINECSFTTNWTDTYTWHYNGVTHDTPYWQLDGVNGQSFPVTANGTSNFVVGGQYKPGLNLKRGLTYTFDLSDSSLGSHPFRISNTSEGDGNGGTSYGAAQGWTINGDIATFVVQPDAPDTLYYYCDNHAGMGNSISITDSVGLGVCPYGPSFFRTSYYQQYYLTNCVGNELSNGFSHYLFTRGCTLDLCFQDAYTNVKTCIDCTSTNKLTPANSALHADHYQMFNSRPLETLTNNQGDSYDKNFMMNYMLYGYDGTDINQMVQQLGVFGTSKEYVNDVAFVNSEWRGSTVGNVSMQIGQLYDHVLVIGITCHGNMFVRGDGTQVGPVLFKDMELDGNNVNEEQNLLNNPSGATNEFRTRGTINPPVNYTGDPTDDSLLEGIYQWHISPTDLAGTSLVSWYIGNTQITDGSGIRFPETATAIKSGYSDVHTAEAFGRDSSGWSVTDRLAYTNFSNNNTNLSNVIVEQDSNQSAVDFENSGGSAGWWLKLETDAGYAYPNAPFNARGAPQAIGDWGGYQGFVMGGTGMHWDGITSSATGLTFTLMKLGESPSGGGGFLVNDAHPAIPIGTGFTSVTPEISSYGTSVGNDERAIARWAEMPYQKWEKNVAHKIGVIAFHMNGIDRVELSANGGDWVIARGLANNPRTGNREYWGTITFDDNTVVDAKGYVELRARVYPKDSGTPLVLQSPMWTGITNTEPYSRRTNRQGLQSLMMIPDDGTTPVKYVAISGDDINGDGTTTDPYRTAQKAVDSVAANITSTGLKVIFQEAGRYEGFTLGFKHNTQQPIELEAGPGVSWREHSGGVGVEIVPPNSTNNDEDRLLWRPYYTRIICNGIRFPVNKFTQFETEESRTDTAPDRDGSTWIFKNCKWEDDLYSWVPGDWLRTSQSYIVAPPDINDGGGIFVDNCLFYGMRYGACGLDMVRNTHQQHITHDSMARTTFSVDCTTDHNQMVQDNPAERDSSDIGGSTAYAVGSVDSGQEYDSASGYNRNLWHCDHFQVQGWTSDNIIHFGFQATRDKDVQNILIGKTESKHSNQAFVNCIFENLEGSITVVSQHASWARHILFENLTILDQDTVFRPDFDIPKQFDDIHDAVEYWRVPDWMNTSEYQSGGTYYNHVPWREVTADVETHWDQSDVLGKPAIGTTVIPNQAFIAKNFIIRNCIFEQIRAEGPHTIGSGITNYPVSITAFNDTKLPPGVSMVNVLDSNSGAAANSLPAFSEVNVTQAPRAIELGYSADGSEGTFPGVWSYSWPSSYSGADNIDDYIVGQGSYREDIHRGNTAPNIGYMPTI